MSDLNQGCPRVRSVYLFTVIALLVVDHEFHNHALVDIHPAWRFFLNCYFNLESLGMRFSPHEASIDQFYNLESFNFLETQMQQLL